MKHKLLSFLVNALCVIAIVFSLLAGWTVISTPRGKAPQLFGYSFLTVLTGSMEPAIPKNSLVVVQAVDDPGTVQIGDVITFYANLGGSGAVLNTHRVVGLVKDGTLAFQTQGDANASADPTLVRSENLLGRVVFHSFVLGCIVSFLCKPYVFLPLVLLPLAVIIITYSRKIIRLAKEEVLKAEQEIEEGGEEDSHE